MKEFRKIPSLKFLYEINRYGVIRNVKSKKVLKQHIDKTGYSTISIRIGTKSKLCKIHRLVAECWIPIPKIYTDQGLNMKDLVINHKDHNRVNNNVNNLEWCTPKENFDYSRNLFMQGVMRHAQETSKPLIAVDLSTNIPIEFNNSTSAAAYICNKYSKTNYKSVARGIRLAAQGTRKHYRKHIAYKYKWSYK